MGKGWEPLQNTSMTLTLVAKALRVPPLPPPSPPRPPPSPPLGPPFSEHTSPLPAQGLMHAACTSFSEPQPQPLSALGGTSGSERPVCVAARALAT